MADKKKLFPDLKKKEESGNVFTDLFDKEKDSEAKKQDDIVDSVVKKSGEKGPILGPKPKTGDVKVAERPSSLGGGVLKLLVFFWILTFGAAYLTMGASFDVLGVNLSVKADELSSDLLDAQAELNVNNYLIAYYYLDSFAYLADSYLYKQSQYDSSYTSTTDKTSLEGDITELKSDMVVALAAAQEKLSEDVLPEDITIETEFSAEVAFKEATSVYLENEIEELESGTSSEDADIQLEIRALEGALTLLENGVFVNELLDLPTDDSLTSDDVSDLVSDFSEITEDNFTVISKIKSDRQKWSEIIRELEDITKEVDPLYGTSVESDIQYSSFSLDLDSKSISLQGKTYTDDSRNFTLIANLIDALEQSEMFMNVAERSFSKSEGSSNDDAQYLASFRLAFDIQEGEDDRDAVFALFEEEEEAEPVSRVAEEETEETEL